MTYRNMLSIDLQLPHTDEPLQVHMPAEGDDITAANFLFLRMSALNDRWFDALQAGWDQPPVTSGWPGEAAVVRAARWGSTSEGRAVLQQIDRHIAFVMLGEDVLTVNAYNGLCRIAGIPLELEVSNPLLGRQSPDGSPALLIACWSDNDQASLHLHYVQLPGLDEREFDGAPLGARLCDYCW